MSIYRLTNEAITGAPSGKNGTVAYGLDPVGNRTSASSTISGLAPVSGTFNPDDELSAETYDQNGNVTSTGGKTFTYDAENHLLSMGSTVGLMYDGDGNRVAKSVSGTATYYLVDDLNPTGYPQVVEELNSGGAVTRQYTYGLQRISQQQAISSTWTPSFYGYDGGGSVRALTNAAGAVTDSYEYDGFGNSFTLSGSTPNTMLYRGEQYDSDLGLYYLRARYYNPLTGRFMSRDPEDGNLINPATLHKYLYVGGDPVNHVDPRGRFLAEYAVEDAKAIPEAKLIDIYGCVAGASLAAVDLILGEINPKDTTGTIGTGLGVGSAALGCVVLVPGLNDLADAGAKVTKAALKFVATASTVSGWGACATNAEHFVDALDYLLAGTPNVHHAVGNEIGESIEDLVNCVGSALGAMLKAEAE